MRAVGYTRVSTSGQAADGVSLEAQQARIQAWCNANGYELASVYTDAGLSGKRADNRPGLQQALDAVCSPTSEPGTALVVYSLSRLARSTRDAITIADRLDKAGADLVSLSERIDTSSAAGKMIFRLLSVLSEFEADLVSERTAAALNHKRAKGERIGTIPLGFDLAADGTTLTANESEQAVIKLIVQLRSAGMSFRAIAADLTARGIRTKQGNLRWSHQAVAAIVARNAA